MMLAEKNDWYVRHARRILQERAAAGKLDEAATRSSLREIAVAAFRCHAPAAGDVGAARDGRTAGRRYRERCSADKDEYVRAWAIQLSLDRDESKSGRVCCRSSRRWRKSDPSPVVRLYLGFGAAADAARQSAGTFWKACVRHAEDADDHNLPLMYWYAAEPLAEADPERALAFGLSCGKTIPLLREFMLRRIGSLNNAPALGGACRGAEQVERRRRAAGHPARHRAARLPASGASSRRRNGRPFIGKLAGNDDQRRAIRGDGAGRDVRRRRRRWSRCAKLCRRTTRTQNARRDALKALLAAKDPDLAATLQRLLAEPTLRDEALTGLAAIRRRRKRRQRFLAVYPSLIGRREARRAGHARVPRGVRHRSC